jgi:hypothetical protein
MTPVIALAYIMFTSGVKGDALRNIGDHESCLCEYTESENIPMAHAVSNHIIATTLPSMSNPFFS